MADPIKRLNYFNGQFLREKDFNDDQSYHIQHQRDHARLLHTPGIAEGLEVPDPPAGATAISINAGVAYEDQGHRIVLADNKPLELAGAPADQAVYVTIAYDEKQTDPTTETGGVGDTRWTEASLVEMSATTPPNPNQKLVLAKVLRTGTIITGIDRTLRQVAGAKGGNLKALSLTLTSDAISPSGWVTMNLGASGRADILGDLQVQGNLSVQGQTTVVSTETMQGNVVLGDADSDTVTVKGSIFTGHSSGHLKIASPVDVTGAINVTEPLTLPVNGLVVGANQLVAAGGNVGIGTSVPTQRLHVDLGDMLVKGVGSFAAAGAEARVFLGDTNHYIKSVFGSGVRIGTAFVGDAITISQSSGNVGIGTATPGKRLDVAGAIRTTSGHIITNSPNGALILNAGPADGSNTAGIWLRKATALGNEGAYVDLMRVTETGNAGIGTISPSSKLHVSGPEPTANGFNAALTLENTSPGGRKWYLRSGATGTLTPAGGMSIADDTTYRLVIQSSGNVGINTTSPQVRLAVNGPGVNVYATDVWIENNMHVQGNETLLQGGRGRMRVGTAWGYIGLYADPSSTGAVNDLVLGASSGRVRIGPDGSGQILRTDILQLGNKWRFSGVGDVSANDDWLRMFDVNNTNYYGGFAAGKLWTAQGSLAGSDARLKKDIKTLHGALNKITSLRGVNFKWENSHQNLSEQLGLIAQEVEPIFPELVTTGPDGMKAINYSGFVAPLIEAIKEQQKKITELSAQNAEHQTAIAEAMSARTGNDFAEYFESVNEKRIKPGTSVVLEEGRVRSAKKGEIPIGAISANPGVLGGMHLEWPGRYLGDEFGARIMEEYKEEIMIPKKQKVKKERQKMEKKTVEEEITRTEVVYKNNKPCQVEKKEKVAREVEMLVFKEVDLYDEKGKDVIGKHRVPVMEAYEEEVTIFDDKGNPVLVGSGKFVTNERPKLNPKYHASKTYVTRDKRPEWNCVGLLGQLRLRKGQPTAPSWVKIKDISDEVELWLVK